MRGRTYDIRGLYAKNACITSLIMTRGELYGVFELAISALEKQVPKKPVKRSLIERRQHSDRQAT